MRLSEHASSKVEAFGVLLQRFEGTLGKQLVDTSVVVGEKVGGLSSNGSCEEVELVQADVLTSAFDVCYGRTREPNPLRDMLLSKPDLFSGVPELAAKLAVQPIHRAEYGADQDICQYR